MKHKQNILVAGIAGASLGTEVAKSLKLAGHYTTFGCDISPLAYGHYAGLFEKTFVADSSDYVNSIVSICNKNNISYVVPGGEAPMNLLSAGIAKLVENGITLASNSASIVQLFSDKRNTFECLNAMGFDTPFTVAISRPEDLDNMTFPCIVKPSTGTGGSDSVFLSANKNECLIYVELLKRNGRNVIVQEYIPLDEGEFTIGVLSLPNKNVVDAVVMKRVFNSKLSVAYKSKFGLISSGYSQGLIDDFSDLKAAAIKIAKTVGSTGPLNIQARVKNGRLVPFEINPRFSASTFLRAKAGFNEVDIYLQHLMSGKTTFNYKMDYGYYLRSFEEIYVPKSGVKND